MKETALLFDLDGTLLDSLLDLRAAVNHQLTISGFPERSVDEVRRFVGNGLKNLMRRALPVEVSPEELDRHTDEMKAYYAAHSRVHTAPYPGILPLLDALTAAGYPIGVVSNKVDSAVKDLCPYYFGDRIAAAVGETAGLPRKPAPDTVHLALAQLQKEKAVYIGDSEVDVETARNAGLPCCSVTWGFRDRETLLNAGAERLFDTPESLCAYLLTLP